jgi:hypothetical protein
MTAATAPLTLVDYANEAVTSGATVTVTRVDGKTATGVLVREENLEGYLKVSTGKRGRPFRLHYDDLTAITFE